MTAAVVDASAAAAWLLPDEDGAGGLNRIAEASLFAPSLFWVELRNILIVCERRARIPEGMAETFLAALDGLGIGYDTTPAEADVLALARRHDLTVYVALYLELALRLRAPLLTLDRRLAAAARSAGAEVLD